MPDDALDDHDRDVVRMVDEGVLVVAAGLRLAAKNRLILDVLADGAHFDRDVMTGFVRTQLSAVIAEREESAAALEGLADRASSRSGRPDHSSDYRKRDAAGLRLRSDVERELASVLQQLLDDGGIVDEIVDAARAGALADMVQHRLAGARDVPIAAEPRERRMSRLAVVRDLQRLARNRGVQLAPARRRRTWSWLRGLRGSR